MKVLIVAPTCSRTDPGEAWLGYQWVSRLSERHEVLLLTYRKRNVSSVKGDLPHTRVVEWTEPPGFGRFERFNSLLKPGYFVFLIRARRWIRRYGARGWADVGFQPVPLAIRYPSPLQSSGIPFVVGPLGGSLEDPPGFAREDTAPWYLRLRRLDRWRVKHDPLLRRTLTDAATVVGIADYVREFLSDIPLRRFVAMNDVGVDELPPAVSRRAHPGDPVRLLFVGRVVRTKGVRDAVRAMGLLRDCPVVLDVVGDGFDRPACEELARELRLEDRVSFHGRRGREEVDAFYRRADISVFPSYREPGGIVVFEAMAMGLPVICADRGGPASFVDDACGIRVDPRTPDEFARGIASAIRRLVDEPDARLAMGVAARAKVGRLGLWESRIQAMEQLLKEAAATGRESGSSQLRV